MDYTIKTGHPAQLRTPCLVLPVFERQRLSAPAKAVDEASGGALGQILKKGDLAGREGETLMLYQLPGVTAERVLLLGCGGQKGFDNRRWAKSLGGAVKALQEGHSIEALLAPPLEEMDRHQVYALARDTAVAAEEAVYRFDRCKSDPQPPRRPLKRLSLLLARANQRRSADRGLRHGEAMAEGMGLAKDLANLPGNLCTPSYLASEARALGRRSRRLKVSVLGEKEMEALGMGALLSVSRGSRQPARLIVMEYKGGKRGARPVALVGKGLTFDAGGISLKPAEKMDEMKYDMCGGASVIGTLAACARLELPINLVGVVPASENLPDGEANKPGDIVTSLSGQTIEVLNTDAEGRLILCDALTYTERFDPAAVVDIATLTGACVVALGHHASGLLGNDDRLAEELLGAGEQCGDRAWRLPLWEDYQQQLESNFADMANIGGRSAGAITAACFLSRFTKKFKWAHLDIAGTAWKSGHEKGATGRPVPLLTQFLLHRCRLAE